MYRYHFDPSNSCHTIYRHGDPIVTWTERQAARYPEIMDAAFDVFGQLERMANTNTEGENPELETLIGRLRDTLPGF